MKQTLVIFALFLVAALAGAQQLPSVTASGPIGSRDVLDVRVLEDSTINSVVTVSDDGTILLNLIGKVDVAGLTLPQVEQKLKSLLEARVLKTATVSVQVSSYGNRPISVVGAVMHPGQINATGNMTLLQAITQAGGLAQTAGSELYVVRTGQNGLTEQLPINLQDLMVNGNPDLNIPLVPNDLINIPHEQPLIVYVMGEVMQPGKKEFRRSQPPTLLQVMAAAGGPTDRASKNVVVKRMVAGKETTVTVNYKAVINGDRPDVVLQDNDTVVVKESVF